MSLLEKDSLGWKLSWPRRKTLKEDVTLFLKKDLLGQKLPSGEEKL